MKSRIISLLLFAAALCPAACRSQILTPTSHSFTMAVTSGPCTPGQAASQCGYVWSIAVLASGTTTCPATSSTSWTPQNPTAPTPAPSTGQASLNSTTSAGETVCGLAQTVLNVGQGSQSNSPPSNVVGPFAVPANTTAPAVNGSEAKLDQPAVPPLKPTPSAVMAKLEPAVTAGVR